MSPFRHAQLNRSRLRVDNYSVMSISNNTQTADPPDESATSPAQLVHELANLLDGSLRNVALVTSQLRHVAADAAAEASGIDDALLHRLDTANGAMQQMAMLLRRWMHRNRGSRTLYTQQITLGTAIDQAVCLLEAGAAAQRIAITTKLGEQARQLPVGPLYPIIANALRNSFEAITGEIGPERADGVIELDCHVEEGEMMVLTIEDTGPGLDPALLDTRGRVTGGRTTKLQGHGLGLGLSREIACSVGGVIRLSNRQSRGARFVLRCPVQRMMESAAAAAPAPGAETPQQPRLAA